jgi:hypothetical protein
MKGTNILLGLIALILAAFLGLQIESQYRDVRYLKNCINDIRFNGIKTDDHVAYCAGLMYLRLQKNLSRHLRQNSLAKIF